MDFLFVYMTHDLYIAYINNLQLVQPLHNILIISGQTRAAGAAASVNGSTSVRCTVVAIVEDVA